LQGIESPQRQCWSDFRHRGLECGIDPADERGLQLGLMSDESLKVDERRGAPYASLSRRRRCQLLPVRECSRIPGQSGMCRQAQQSSAQLVLEAVHD
jgi:hypothetical protein